jgi:hypothetical protein
MMMMMMMMIIIIIIIIINTYESFEILALQTEHINIFEHYSESALFKAARHHELGYVS